MSTEQLKNLLIDKISEIEDESFLQALKVIVDKNAISTVTFKLTEEQQQKLSAGLKQLNSGEMITKEDLEIDEDEWLKE